ncbi:hypothetical protein HY218_01775 [Candidatus Saccharibacteria bacterium]|nr:hypothetical protein [Candidatus Saccharibacteria bacterium]
MMRHEAKPSPRPLERALEAAYGHYNGWRETDMQFQISRIEGLRPRGLDIVHGSGRLLIVENSDLESERIVAKNLGAQAILKRSRHEGIISTYRIPKDARLLVKTLRQAPFVDPYMEHLALRAGTFMHNLAELDPGLFGITIENVAITHDGKDSSRDDVVLTVVPPLMPMHAASTVTPEQIVGKAAPYLQGDQIGYFEDGLRGQNHAAH